MKAHQNERRQESPVWFLELKCFSASWSDLHLTIEDLLSLQDAIAANPRYFPVIPGTGGLRKMRFAPPSSAKGKRGSLRVCFAIFARLAAIVLVLVYRKNKTEDLSGAEKKAAKNLLAELEQELAQKMGH